jgi:AmmeMemoRadiSam system protein A
MSGMAPGMAPGFRGRRKRRRTFRSTLAPEPAAPQPALMHRLEPAERTLLLDLARTTVEATARDESLPALDPAAQTPGVVAPGAAFVTLHERGELRGCIGMLAHERPLWVNVRDSAVAAARDDPRFLPVGAEELPAIDIEISVLEPPRRIAEASEFVAGRHGIVIERGMNRGLLLPQVATEMGWGEAEMLAGVCRKAGLRPDAWRDPATRLYVFESFCFGGAESSPAGGSPAGGSPAESSPAEDSRGGA